MTNVFTHYYICAVYNDIVDCAVVVVEINFFFCMNIVICSSKLVSSYKVMDGSS